MNLLKNPLILALDVDTKEEALKILNSTGDLIGGVKLGPRLVYRYGSDFVAEVSKVTCVFIDNKYFDISSTMAAAVRTSFNAGATLVTVHALAGANALKELFHLETELNKVRPFKILAVTILTSWDHSTLPASFQKWSIEEHVRSLTLEVSNSGLTGLVCSGHELAYINQPNLFKVVPGIRLAMPLETNKDDQMRTMSPQQALAAGASALVIGRPILQAIDPREKVIEILESCKNEKK